MQLEETGKCRHQPLEDMVRSIEMGRVQVTDNFDIFELTLRRYHQQVCIKFNFQVLAMFPTGIRETRTQYVEVIQDPNARQLWKNSVGMEPVCSFDQFTQIMRRTFPDLDSCPDQVFRYFVDFPSDKMVTTYKWSLLIRLFGPYPR